MLLPFVSVLALAELSLCSYVKNLNYRSAAANYEWLGIDLPKVTKRFAGIRKKDIDPSTLNFTHGVASGDPYPNSVILWTRISPVLDNDRSNVTVSGTVPLYNHDTEQYIQASTQRACVEYRVSTDKNFTSIVDQGTAYTTSDIDFTVKVEAKNLKPFTTYYYQFNVCGSIKKSPLGRTKTSPNAADQIKQIGLAVYSCSQYQNGYFNAYGNSARKDQVDYVLHLGDYIYESTKGVVGKDSRATRPSRTIFTLYDYRTRIAQYRTDPDLLLSHQQFAWIPVWDDHEISNNGWRDGSSALNNTESSFIQDGGVSVDQRKMNAVRAYFEWMPIRQVEMEDNLRIWRSFAFGNLFDLIMLDTRNYDRAITTTGWSDNYIEKIRNNAGRTLMGSRQEHWLQNTFSASASRGAKWRIIGNQIVFSHLNMSAVSDETWNNDAWDGYTASRNRTLKHLYDNNIGNNIMLSGDSHANWVSDLIWDDHAYYNPTTGGGSPIGAEFAGTAVTSSGYGSGGTIAQSNAKSRGLVKDNGVLQWSEGWFRGYFELQITAESVVARYFGCPTVATRNPYEISLANFTIVDGANHLSRPVSGGIVENGALQTGTTRQTNLTLDTQTGKWLTIGFDQMFIQY